MSFRRELAICGGTVAAIVLCFVLGMTAIQSMHRYCFHQQHAIQSIIEGYEGITAIGFSGFCEGAFFRVMLTELELTDRPGAVLSLNNSIWRWVDV